MEDWIGIEAAASYLDVTKDTIRNWIKKTDIPAELLENFSTTTSLYWGNLPFLLCTSHPKHSSNGHALAILTNFENLHIYDTTNKPEEGDSASTSLYRKYSYKEYVDKYQEIADLISRDNVYSGQYDELSCQK